MKSATLWVLIIGGVLFYFFFGRHVTATVELLTPTVGKPKPDGANKPNDPTVSLFIPVPRDGSPAPAVDPNDWG